jgi:hypothetical protein
MEDLLRNLLVALEEIGEEHEELYDSEVRERMSNAIMDGFVRLKPDSSLPKSFGMHSTNADNAVRTALAAYIQAAKAKAAELRLTAFRNRLDAFQNEDVASEEGNYFDDFFGWSNPDSFDADGNVTDRRD